jgi:hypothetical protein
MKDDRNDIDLLSALRVCGKFCRSWVMPLGKKEGGGEGERCREGLKISVLIQLQDDSLYEYELYYSYMFTIHRSCPPKRGTAT